MENEIEIVSGRFGGAALFVGTDSRPPTHAVVSKKAWLRYGNAAVPFSRHWSEWHALRWARDKQDEHGEEMVVVHYTEYTLPQE